MYILFPRIPVAVRDFSLLQSVQPHEAYVASYSRGSGASFSGGKTAEARRCIHGLQIVIHLLFLSVFYKE
jgi:hypothetical protein